jgi:hypothetical protein
LASNKRQRHKRRVTVAVGIGVVSDEHHLGLVLHVLLPVERLGLVDALHALHIYQPAVLVGGDVVRLLLVGLVPPQRLHDHVGHGHLAGALPRRDHVQQVLAAQVVCGETAAAHHGLAVDAEERPVRTGVHQVEHDREEVALAQNGRDANEHRILHGHDGQDVLAKERHLGMRRLVQEDEHVAEAARALQATKRHTVRTLVNGAPLNIIDASIAAG